MRVVGILTWYALDTVQTQVALFNLNKSNAWINIWGFSVTVCLWNEMGQMGFVDNNVDG